MYKLKISFRTESGDFSLDGQSHRLYNSNNGTDIAIKPVWNLDGDCVKYKITIGTIMGSYDAVYIDLKDIRNSEVYSLDSELKYKIYKSKEYTKLNTKEYKIINLTPHTVNIVNQEGKEIKAYKSEGIARVSTSSKLKTVIDGVNIYSTEYGEVEGLPEEKKDTYYIVSMLVKQACPNRKDLLSPSQLQRDSEGKIIGCLGLE